MIKTGKGIRWFVRPFIALQRNLAQRAVIAIVLIAALTVTGCSDTTDPDEGGIIGTGVVLQGAVSDSAVASNNVLKAKSADGQLTEIPLDASNRFSTSSLSGKGPWVLAARSSTNVSVYGVAYSDGTRNINRFSDLSLRSWFARESIDLDSEFNSSDRFTSLPTAAEYDTSAANVFQLIEPVLASYDVRGADVISTEYADNDTGVDGFLNRNTVLLDNGLVTFVFTDPSTKTQSVTRSTLVLENDFLDNGASAPSVPGGVKALGSASDEIIVVWKPSADDIAVREYQVLRDGGLIATTPYPVYIDSGLLAVQPYSYQVIAVDGAGNASEPSAPVLASPLLVDDDVPPPAPSLLVELATSDSAIQILWAQSDIEDVASFNVYRGDSAELTNPLFQVTSTFATDTTVRENETYCYQVEAVDASGNVSDLSDVLCLTASDDAGAGGNMNEPLVEWNVPDIESLSCDQVLSSAQIPVGITVLPVGCYSVPTTLTIIAGATLTLTEGTVLKFGDKAKILIPDEATLTINGTPQTPVVLTGELSLRGYWGGIEFQGSRSAGNLIRGAVVQYAGGADSKAAISSLTSGSRFRMEDTLVRFNQDWGIRFEWAGNVLDSFQGNRITDNDEVGILSLEIMQSLLGNSEYIDNERNEFAVARNAYSEVQISVPDLGIPVSWNGVQIRRGSLNIEPGVVFEMVPGAVIDVEGTFTALGTAEQPILLKGTSAVAGQWDGLSLSGRGDKTLEHVNISYAGQARPDSGAIDIACSAENAANVNIDHVEISDSKGWGIFVGGVGCTTVIGENNTYFNNVLGNVSVP